MKKTLVFTLSIVFISILFSGCFGLFHNHYHDTPPEDHPARHHR